MAYKCIESKDIEFIRSIIEPERVIVGEMISEDYGHDELGGVESMPEVLIKVRSTKEISAIMTYANGHKLPIVVRGAGTGLVGAAVAICGGIMLETTGMNKILELDRENLTLTVESGVGGYGHGSIKINFSIYRGIAAGNRETGMVFGKIGIFLVFIILTVGIDHPPCRFGLT